MRDKRLVDLEELDLIVNKDSPNPEESFMQTSMKKDFDSVLKKLTERQRNEYEE